jgi:DNA-directed RNA polymerase specialized sigma24 family protein
MPEESVSAELRKMARLLAMAAIAERTKGQAATLLARCGFANQEIALLLDTSEGSVRALLSQGRRGRDETTTAAGT